MRTAPTDCPSLVPRAGTHCRESTSTSKLPSDECFDDRDCKAHPNGSCQETGGCTCVYGCVRDSDCATNQLCECGNPVGRCVTAKCTDDSKCGGGSSLCASAVIVDCGADGTNNGGIYVCQTAADKCKVGSDCNNGLISPGSHIDCGFDVAAGIRDCGGAGRCAKH